MTSLYEDFMQCHGAWRNSIIYKSIKRTSRSGVRGVRKWLTRSQMMKIFEDEEIVKAIILRKENDPTLAQNEIREHPECPGLPLAPKTFILLANWKLSSHLCGRTHSVLGPLRGGGHGRTRGRDFGPLPDAGRSGELQFSGWWC